MIIRNGYIRKSMNEVFPMFIQRFGLKHYTNRQKPFIWAPRDEPLVMFGCYSQLDARIARWHSAPLIMVWMGMDFALFGSRKLWRRKNIYHVAIGKWMEQDLQKRGLRYKRVNLIGSPLVDSLQPEPLGNAVYAYWHAERPEYYGASLVAEVQQRLEGEMEFIIHKGLTTPQDQMPDVYRKCFAGLRLVEHDGGSETVIEMGLMGRFSIHNGDTPCSLIWENVDDIVDSLRALYIEREETETARLSADVYAHIQMTDEWLDLDWWQD